MTEGPHRAAHRQGKAFVLPFARDLSGCAQESRILLTDTLSGVEDLLGLTKHLPGENKGGEEQEQCPDSTDGDCGCQWKSKEAKKQVASKIMQR